MPRSESALRKHTAKTNAISEHKSKNKVESSKLKSDKSQNEKRARGEKAGGTDGASEHRSKRTKTADTAAQAKHDSSSGHAKSAIKGKDSKRPKTSSQSVRFDPKTTNRPKIDIFQSGVHSKENNSKHPKKRSSTSSSNQGTQMSGISSAEGGGVARRRKKSSVGGKSKASALQMKGFDDDGGFL